MIRTRIVYIIPQLETTPLVSQLMFPFPWVSRQAKSITNLNRSCILVHSLFYSFSSFRIALYFGYITIIACSNPQIKTGCFIIKKQRIFLVWSNLIPIKHFLLTKRKKELLAEYDQNRIIRPVFYRYQNLFLVHSLFYFYPYFRIALYHEYITIIACSHPQIGVGCFIIKKQRVLLV